MQACAHTNTLRSLHMPDTFPWQANLLISPCGRTTAGELRGHVCNDRNPQSVKPVSPFLFNHEQQPGPQLRVAVVGATGMVGRTMLKVLEKRAFPVGHLDSCRVGPVGGEEWWNFAGEHVEVVDLDTAL